MNETKSWWESKINWTQVLGVVASVLTVFGFVVPPELIPAVVALITALQGLMTIVFRTWFTTKEVKQSVRS